MDLGRLETALCPGVLPPVYPTADIRPRRAALAARRRALVGTALAGDWAARWVGQSFRNDKIILDAFEFSIG